jgi:FkbM family methyltransferase
MTLARIAEDLRIAVKIAPGYIRARLAPTKPVEPVAPKTVETIDGAFLIQGGDRVVSKAITNGGYDQVTRRELVSTIQPDDVVAVIGAHVGLHAIPLARRCRRLIAVEANPETADLLRRNVEAHGLSDRIRVIEAAVADHAGEITMERGLAGDNTGGVKILPKRRRFYYGYDGIETFAVKCDTLDALLADEPAVDVALMDIEGSEVAALRGWPKGLAHVRVLAMEFLPHHLDFVAGASVKDLARLLERHFAKIRFPHGRPKSRGPVYDALSDAYLRREEHPAVFLSKDA